MNERTPCALITIAALTGEVSGVHLYDPGGMYARGGSIEFRCNLQQALPDLAEGGYVCDLRPLAGHPHLTSWVARAPLPNGDIEGACIQRLPEPVRESASQMQAWLSDDFRAAATMMAANAGEPSDGSAGPFDHVSAAYLARYWEAKGARIGRRVGKSLRWNDGEDQEIISGG